MAGPAQSNPELETPTRKTGIEIDLYNMYLYYIYIPILWPKHKSSCTGAKDRPTKGSHGLRSHSRISSVIGCPFEKTSGVLVSRFRSVSGQN
jgi:hypothetical protein